jgi:hypothetical protein
MGFGKLISKGTDFLGLTDSGAGDRAYAAQAEATREANETLKQNYGEAKDRYGAYSDQGAQSFGQLANLTNQDERFSTADNPMRNHSGVFGAQDFEQDPGYQFRMEEGLKAVNRGAAAGGGRGGGATMKALARFGQGLASEEYGNAYNRFNQDYQNSYNRFNQDQANQFNRLGNLVNYGQNANNMITNAGMQTAQGISGNQMGLGNAQASMELNRGNDLKQLWQQGFKGVGALAGMA